jgi:hypothetical protein
MRYDNEDVPEWEFEVIHNSRPPLRWIANLFGSIASRGLLETSYMEDEGYTGWKYKLNIFLWNTFWPTYQKYGTFYKMKTEEDYLD